MLFIREAGKDQPLPVPVKRILAAAGVIDNAAAGGKRREQQVDFGIVAQRLKMPHPLDGVGDRLAVQDLAFVEADVHVKPFADQFAEDFLLHPSHQAHMDTVPAASPLQMQLRVLFLKQQQLRIKCGGIKLGRKNNTVRQDGLQNRLSRLLCRTQCLSGKACAEAENGGNLSG